MARRIDINDVEFDEAARRLHGIGDTLKNESRLKRGLVKGIEGPLAGEVLKVVVAAQQTADAVGESCHRQAGELTNRAVFARIADDRGTEKDVELLVAMSVGPKAIDLEKRKSYRWLLNKVKEASTDIATKGGKDGFWRPIDDALGRWASWIAQRNADIKYGVKPQPTTYTQLYTDVFGKEPPAKNKGTDAPSTPSLGGGDPVDPAVDSPNASLATPASRPNPSQNVQKPYFSSNAHGSDSPLADA